MELRRKSEHVFRDIALVGVRREKGTLEKITVAVDFDREEGGYVLEKEEKRRCKCGT